MSRPTLDSLVVALKRAVGDSAADAVVKEALGKTGLSVDRELSVPQLLDVSESIAQTSGVPSVVGLSMQLRCETYLVHNVEDSPS